MSNCGSRFTCPKQLSSTSCLSRAVVEGFDDWTKGINTHPAKNRYALENGVRAVTNFMECERLTLLLCVGCMKLSMCTG